MTISPREREVISHLLEGKTNFEIGLALNIFEGGVKYHLTNLYKKFKVKSRHALLVKVSHLKVDMKTVIVPDSEI